MIGCLFLESSTMFLTFENYCVNQVSKDFLFLILQVLLTLRVRDHGGYRKVFLPVQRHIDAIWLGTILLASHLNVFVLNSLKLTVDRSKLKVGPGHYTDSAVEECSLHCKNFFSPW